MLSRKVDYFCAIRLSYQNKEKLPISVRIGYTLLGREAAYFCANRVCGCYAIKLSYSYIEKLPIFCAIRLFYSYLERLPISVQLGYPIAT